MNAFLTGSHVYGSPKPESDVDLVVLVNHHTAEVLRGLAGVKADAPIRFGKLNLILCLDDDEFSAWRTGTTTLQLRANGGGPISKEVAQVSFDKIRELMGISYHNDSGEE